MQAIFFHSGGRSDVLQYGEMPSPQHCTDHQVLVRIKAIGINPIDIKIRTAPDRFPVTFPVIPGCDGAGIVDSVGTQVQHFKPGDEVYFSQLQNLYSQASILEEVYNLHQSILYQIAYVLYFYKLYF